MFILGCDLSPFHYIIQHNPPVCNIQTHDTASQVIGLWININKPLFMTNIILTSNIEVKTNIIGKYYKRLDTKSENIR